MEIKKGDTLFVMLYSRSKSGLSRFYRVFVADAGKVVDVTRFCATKADLRVNRRPGNKPFCIEVRGGGFCGAQEITEQVSFALFEDAESLKYEKL